MNVQTDRNKKKIRRSWKLLGALLIFLGVCCLTFSPDFIRNYHLQDRELHRDSQTFSEWEKPTAPQYFNVYIFNWTNPEEISNSSSKPRFDQIGPYRFRKQREKINITFSDDDSLVRYRELSTYYFDMEGSKCLKLSDVWTTVNMVAVSAANQARNLNYGFQKQKNLSVALIQHNESIFVRKTVRELLFDGYDDDMITLTEYFNQDTPFDKPGFLTKRNATDMLSGDFTVHTGVDDIQKLGTISKYNNLTYFPYYDGECEQLKGSAGDFFSPKLSKDDPVFLFAPELCRSIPLEYESDVEVHGVTGHRFVGGERALDAASHYEENKCLATKEQSLPSGLINVSHCTYDDPVFRSFPHFYGADPFYLERVEGLAPEKEKHQMYMTLEPLTGITLEAVQRIQTNVLIDKYGDFICIFDTLSKVYMPLFWIEEKFVINSENAGRIRMELRYPWISQIFGGVLIVIGFAMMCSYFWDIFRKNPKSGTDSQILMNELNAEQGLRDQVREEESLDDPQNSAEGEHST